MKKYVYIDDQRLLPDKPEYDMILIRSLREFREFCEEHSASLHEMIFDFDYYLSYSASGPTGEDCIDVLRYSMETRIKPECHFHSSDEYCNNLMRALVDKLFN